MSRKNKNPNRINADEAVELFEGFGFKAVKFNYYQIRISPEETNRFYDWFHTTGSLTVNNSGFCSKIGSCRDAETVAELIRTNLKLK